MRRSEVSGRVPNLGSRSGIPPGNPPWRGSLASPRFGRAGEGINASREGRSCSRTAASLPAGSDRSPLFTCSGHSSRVGRSGAARGVPGNVHDVRLRVAGGRSPLGRALRPSRARMYNSAVRCPEWAGRVLTTRPFSVYSAVGRLFRVGVRAVHLGDRHSRLTAAIGVGSSDSPNPSERQSSAGRVGAQVVSRSPVRGGCHGFSLGWKEGWRGPLRYLVPPSSRAPAAPLGGRGSVGTSLRRGPMGLEAAAIGVGR